jgi:hypothetical protein
MRQSLQDVVLNTLSEMGIANPGDLIRTFALQEGCLVAEKLRYDGGYALWPVGGDVVKFYDDDARLLKKVRIATGEKSGTAA